MKIKYTIEVDVEFGPSYGKIYDEKAKSEIKKWLKSAIKNDGQNLPVYVKVDAYGSAIEDYATVRRVVFKKKKDVRGVGER